MTRLQELAEAGQAVWIDYIRRSCITSGEMQALIDKGIRGATSNPVILGKAIAGSADYDETINSLTETKKSDKEIYKELVLDDIGRAADLLLPVYQKTGGLDGYVCLDLDPALTFDADATINEAWHLFSKLHRLNVMVKVPATYAGISAAETLTREGVNVNVTLIFSQAQYKSVTEAFIQGVEDRIALGGDISSVASVASISISTMDTVVDLELDKIGNVELKGKIAMANAKLFYSLFQEIFSKERWERLAAHGARVQRMLWCDTCAKNPIYPDTLYINNLIGPDTVNTVSPTTLNAFLKQGRVAPTLTKGVDSARALFNRLSDLGLDMDAITQQFLKDGITSFTESFEDLMADIAKKREQLTAGRQRAVFDLGEYRNTVEEGITELRDKKVIHRIWSHDHTVWDPKPEEITNRLGWLHAPEKMRENILRLTTIADSVRADGYTQVLLLGMGGSSLAPEVFYKTFGAKEGYPELAVLDSTDPGTVSAHAERLAPERTLFIVSTKSGTTIETDSFFKFFYNWISNSVGENTAGEHFIAVTDPGSRLAYLADRLRFRATFLNDPNIGGRYSALSYFGLVPAALIGLDLQTLLGRALTMTCNCESCNCIAGGNNYGGRLGVILGELANVGRDKVTVVASPKIAGFGDWLEQLIAESTGKEGKGILPVVDEPLGVPDAYGKDRLFVHLCLQGDTSHDTELFDLKKAGHPVVKLSLDDIYDLGGQIFLWEMAVAVAGSLLGINPFDQPNVEASKVLARDVTARYKKKKSFPSEKPSIKHDGIFLYGKVQGKSLANALTAFIEQGDPGAYVALQVYVQPTNETDDALQALRTSIRDQFHLATTVGYGPRYLHSTGQLHKGDAGNGLFIQLTADDPSDAPIPDEAGSSKSSITFGALKTAQAIGDRRALLDAGRKVIRLHLGKNPVENLQALNNIFSRESDLDKEAI